MELAKEFIEQHKLSDDQVKAVTEYGKTVLTTEKTKIEDEWKGKAHADAQGIIAGALTSIEKLTGVKRNEGDKAADYIAKAATEFTNSKKSELDKLKSEYEEKIKGVKDAGSLKEEFEKMKAEKDEILKKYADYDTLKEQAVKADEYGKELSGLKLEVAFTSLKPAFPNTVNEYEAKAKWEEFRANVLKEYTIELVNGVPTAVSIKNSYDTKKLADLIAKDEAIQGLLKGRQQQGSGAKQGEKTKIEGLPFEVPVNADTKEYAQLIREQLAKESIPGHDPRFPERFKKYMELIKSQKTAA